MATLKKKKKNGCWGGKDGESGERERVRLRQRLRPPQPRPAAAVAAAAARKKLLLLLLLLQGKNVVTQVAGEGRENNGGHL